MLVGSLLLETLMRLPDTHEVHMPKHLTLVDSDIALVVVAREDVAHLSSNDEVHFNDLFSFFEDVLLFFHIHRPNGLAHPDHEALLLSIKKLNILEHLSIDGHGKLQLELVREFFHELKHVFLLLTVVIAYSFHKFVE